MAVIKPTLKENKRYLLYEVESEDINNINHKKIYNLIKETFQHYFGFIELEKAGLMPVANISQGKYGVLRIERSYADKLRTCFVFIKKTGDKKISIKSLLLSGVLNKIKEKIKEKND